MHNSDWPLSATHNLLMIDDVKISCVSNWWVHPNRSGATLMRNFHVIGEVGQIFNHPNSIARNVYQTSIIFAKLCELEYDL